MIWNTCLILSEYVVGSGSHVQYYHARQKKKTNKQTKKREEKLSTWS